MKDIFGLININRGIAAFYSESKCNCRRCSFSMHPADLQFCASLVEIWPSGLIIKIKTRRANDDGSLASLEKLANYTISFASVMHWLMIILVSCCCVMLRQSMGIFLSRNCFNLCHDGPVQRYSRRRYYRFMVPQCRWL